MQEWLIPLTTAVITFAATAATAYFAFRAKRIEVKETGWGTLSEAWERRLNETEDEIRKLNEKVSQHESKIEGLEVKLRDERRRSWITLTYLRQVLAWVCSWKPEEATLPPPPEELQQELSPFLRGL
ncbi:hypothetical protein ACRAJ3_09675 [Rhodococcus pyridinivorans]|uniref:hypothetical protein n=1 Tax=Rhodococcus pyridinivorans TaxID=103816 RepID=UPI00200011E0|nr:hypothetical protein [Rhodococcus pyridinivorans]UPK64909.1 hypothetical protein MYP14_06035 [Rhodococcus pyridinivorans]